jgi:hypothetical protein
MQQQIRLTADSPSFQLDAKNYFGVLYPKRIESNRPVSGEPLTGLKMVLMNDRYRFNQFSWYKQTDNAFTLHDWLQPARSIEPLQEAQFNRLEISVEGLVWREGMEIVCEIEWNEGMVDAVG